MIFVTHSVFESAFLSNRIVVMKARPGQVYADIPLSTILERNSHYRTSEQYRHACEKASRSLIEAMERIGGARMSVESIETAGAASPPASPTGERPAA